MKKIDLSFLSLSEDYLHTSKMVFTELKESGNKWIIIADTEITNEMLGEKTKWSDFNVLIPGLLLFYHGLELIIKGLLLLKNVKVEGHGIENLYVALCKEFCNETKLKSIVKRYAYINNMDSSELIKKFVTQNNEINSTKKLYQAFRYPSNLSMDDDYYDYSPMFYREKEIIDTIDAFIKDIDNILIESVRISRIFEGQE